MYSDVVLTKQSYGSLFASQSEIVHKEENILLGELALLLAGADSALCIHFTYIN